MIHAKEASEKLRSMTPEERFEAIKSKVSESTRNALDAKIRETISLCESRVEIILGEEICRDPDANIRGLLSALGYNEISVTSDFPGYCESYTGTTRISFSIPVL